MTETRSTLGKYLSRCISVGLVLWLLFLAACGGPSPKPTPTPSPTGKCPPAAASSQALSLDNTIYKYSTPCTTRFWRAGTIVVAMRSPGLIQQFQQTSLETSVQTQIQKPLSDQNFLKLDPSMKMVRPVLLGKITEQPNSVLLASTHGSTLAVFFALYIDFKDGSTKLIGDNNLVKAVNAINMDNKILTQQLPGASPDNVIAGASPDWLSGGGGGGFTGGHPDGDPTEDQNNAPWWTSCTKSSGPMIYVLDTAPPLGTGQTHTNVTMPLTDPSMPVIASDQVPDSATPNCDFYHDIGASIQETDVKFDDTDLGLRIFNPQSNDNPPSKNAGELRGHGLFVSDIIHRIAPQASIRLIRVLNDYGVGDLLGLFKGFEIISAEQARLNIQKAIVNMSLGVVPAPQCLLDIWENLPGWENQNGGTLNQPQANMNTCNVGNIARVVNDSKFQRLYLPLALMIHQLEAVTQDQLVAAAGNDSTDSTKFLAELPAGFCDVIAVGAANGKVMSNWTYLPGTPLSSFSNIPYFDFNAIHHLMNCLDVEPVNGILRERAITGNPPVVAQGVGICSLFPHGVNEPPFNPKGLVIWPGTSFSTAIISGNIAIKSWPFPAGTVLNENQPC